MNIFPRDYRGNLFSQIFFFWQDKFFIKGFRNRLTHSDLHPCQKEHSSKEIYEIFDKDWLVELKKSGTPGINISLAKSLYSLYLIGGLFLFIEMIILQTEAMFIGVSFLISLYRK